MRFMPFDGQKLYITENVINVSSNIVYGLTGIGRNRKAYQPISTDINKYERFNPNVFRVCGIGMHCPFYRFVFFSRHLMFTSNMFCFSSSWAVIRKLRVPPRSCGWNSFCFVQFRRDFFYDYFSFFSSQKISRNVRRCNTESDIFVYTGSMDRIQRRNFFKIFLFTKP